MGELEKIVTSVYLTLGKKPLTEREISMFLSMKQQWFKLSEARKVVELAVSKGLLKQEGGGLVPTFDINAQEIEISFKPSENVLTQNRFEDIFMAIVDTIVSATNLEKRTIISHINKAKNSMGVTIEVAALVVARRYDVDVSRFIDEAEKGILKPENE
jgi:hypothetical protein